MSSHTPPLPFDDFPLPPSSATQPPRAPRDTETRPRSLKSAAIDLAVYRLRDQGLAPAKARSAILSLFKKYTDEDVILAIHRADRNDAADLMPYLRAVLDTPGRFRKTGPAGAAPAPTKPKNPRPIVTPELMGVSERSAQNIRARAQSFKLDLKLPE